MMPLHVTALVTSVVIFSQNGSAMIHRANHLQVRPIEAKAAKQ